MMAATPSPPLRNSNSTISSIPVLISGGGPIGLYEAYLLTKLGIQVKIIEREMGVSPLSKAFGMQPRSLEILSMTGIIDPFLNRGMPLQEFNLYIGTKHSATFSVTDYNSHFDSGLVLEQAITSEILIEELEKLGVKVDHGWELLNTKVVEEFVVDEKSEPRKKNKKTYVESTIRRALSGDNTSPDEKKSLGEVSLLDEQPHKEYETQVVRSEYLIGADGGRSTVRAKLNIGFPGVTRDIRTMMWDGTFEGDFKPLGITNIYGVNRKVIVAFPLTNGDYRMAVQAGKIDPNEKLSLDDVTVEKFEELINECIAPSKFKIRTTSWLTVFKINERRAENFVYKNRVFLAGDAAHVHSPAGGQGLNTGMQDAHNLAWKLAYVLNGIAPESLLETYREREAMADRAISLSSKLLNLNIVNTYMDHIKKLISYKAAPVISYILKLFSIGPDVSMLNVRYQENSLNRRHATQPLPGDKYQVGVRAHDGPLKALEPSVSLELKTIPTRLHEVMKGIGRFHILVFTSSMLAVDKSNSGYSEIHGIKTTSAKELCYNIDSHLARWQSKWSYSLDMQDGHEDQSLFKVHTIAGSLAFLSENENFLNIFIAKKSGEGNLYLDDGKTVHQRYGVAWTKGAGGIVVVRPDSHIGFRVDGAGEQAWKDVEEYFESILSE
ncbi:hypothetical protein BGZ76_003843 [Entomortierella beljakovae]|nr:hypothetical protein BGZ76_003843 [Entomortierella beljakovae]